jgi:hypothetical protein
MQEGLKLFTKNTNRWKGFEGELKGRFEQLPTLDLMALEALWPKLTSNAVRGDGLQKQFIPDLPQKKIVQTARRITFTRELNEIEKVSRYLFDEVREPNEVGERCFGKTLSEAKK